MTLATAEVSGNQPARAKAIAAPLMLAAAILLAWEVSVRLLAVPRYVLPPPTQIAAEIVIDRRIIFSQLSVTLFEILSGYALSCVVGFCLSILIVYKIVLEDSAPWAKELPLSTSHSNRSLRTEVSVAGKRNFQGRDREAETATEVQGRPCRDKISLATPPIRG